MSALAQKIMDQFHISYNELSHLLFIPKPTIQSSISRFTSLPRKATHLLSSVLQYVGNVEDGAWRSLENWERKRYSEEEKEYVSYELKLLRHKLDKAKMELERTEKKYQVAMIRKYFADSSREGLSEEEAEVHVIRGLDVIRIRAELKMRKHNYLAKLKLRRKIAGLEAEIKCLEVG